MLSRGTLFRSLAQVRPLPGPITTTCTLWERRQCCIYTQFHHKLTSWRESGGFPSKRKING